MKNYLIILFLFISGLLSGQNSNNNDNSNKIELERELFFNTCSLQVRNFNKSESKDGLFENLYCNCMIDKWVSKGKSISSLKEAINSDSKESINLIRNCYSLALDSLQLRNKQMYVDGSESVCEVPIFNFSGRETVQVKIGGMEYYFIIDSGASDLVISPQVKKMLIATKILKPEDFIDGGQTRLADGSIVKTQTFILDEIMIGSCKIYIVGGSVIDGDKGLSLLGKEVLDKFKSWTIDNNNETLKLIRY